eukprot:758707-Hanusia_phi.AAC.5
MNKKILGSYRAMAEVRTSAWSSACEVETDSIRRRNALPAANGCRPPHRLDHVHEANVERVAAHFTCMLTSLERHSWIACHRSAEEEQMQQVVIPCPPPVETCYYSIRAWCPGLRRGGDRKIRMWDQHKSILNRSSLHDEMMWQQVA